ncbi:MAG: hypothetical protein ACYS9X_09100 [Planctomycetota bacterium]|jgi:hypothetical protein
MPEDIEKPEGTAPGKTGSELAAERDAQLRAGIYVALAAAAVVVLMTLAMLGRSGRVYAAGTALGLEDVALKLEQGSVEEARQRLREAAPMLREMGWDTSPEVDAALRQIRRTDREVYLEALRYLTGHKQPEPPRQPREEKPKPDVWPRPQPQPRIYPSAI